MKKVLHILLFLTLLCHMSFGQSQRKVLIELFTSASCGPCKYYADDLYPLLDANPGKFAMVEYHVQFSKDPMSDQNTYDPGVRQVYYSIYGIPYGSYDGANGTVPSQSQFDAYYNTPAKFDINLTHHLSPDGDSVFVTAVYKATQNVSGDLRAFIAVVEENINFLTPPGYNGEKDFRYVLKKMLNTPYGITLPNSFTSGDSVVINESGKIENFYDLSQLGVTAWVQDYGTKTVHQSAYSSPVPLPFNISLTSVNNKHLNVTGSNSTSTFDAVFSTDLGNSDTYTFKMDKSGLPNGWTADFTIDANTQSDSMDVVVPALGNKNITVHITSAGNDDETGSVRLYAYNKNIMPAYHTFYDYEVHSNVTNLVIDMGYIYDSWWFDWCLEDMGRPTFTIYKDAFDNIDSTEFTSANIDHIITTTDYYASPTIYTDEEIGKITRFMDSGGDVFIAGSNIGPAQSNGSSIFQDFYANYLGASFVSTGDDIGYVLDPVNSDPVFGNSDYKDTLRTDWYSLSADWVSANGQNAAPFISYGEESSTYGAIRNEIPSKNCKSCYLGWAFHMTYNLPSKENILAMCLDWFDGYWAAGMGEENVLSQYLYPNPANDFAICEFKTADTSLELTLTDIFGRRVYTQHILPGQDIARINVSSLPDGVYICQITDKKTGNAMLSNRLLVSH